MRVYFVVEENVSDVESAKGTKYFCKSGVRYPFGEFKKEYGFTDEHKANLELKAAVRFWNQCSVKTREDVWIHYIEPKKL